MLVLPGADCEWGDGMGGPLNEAKVFIYTFAVGYCTFSSVPDVLPFTFLTIFQNFSLTILKPVL